MCFILVRSIWRPLLGELLPDYEMLRPQIVKMICEEGMTTTQVAESVGYPPSVVRMWLRRDDYQAKIREYHELFEEQMMQLSVAQKSRRIADLQTLLNKQKQVIDERATAYSHIPVGGGSGLLVKQTKSVGTGPTAYEVSEYVYDSAIVKDILSIHKQAAIELGQWSEKSENVSRVEHQVNVIRFEAQAPRDMSPLLDAPVGTIDAEFHDAES